MSESDAEFVIGVVDQIHPEYASDDEIEPTMAKAISIIAAAAPTTTTEVKPSKVPEDMLHLFAQSERLPFDPATDLMLVRLVANLRKNDRFLIDAVLVSACASLAGPYMFPAMAQLLIDALEARGE